MDNVSVGALAPLGEGDVTRPHATARVFGLWHGGSSYGHGDFSTDLEVFASIADAKRALRERHEVGSWSKCTFAYADGRVEHVYCPVTDGSSMLLYLGDPRDERDPYPDRELAIGPRGGVSVSRL